MFEKFTNHARATVVIAQEEACGFNHAHIGAEHILLGLLQSGDNVGFRALEALGVRLDAAQAKLEEISGRGLQESSSRLPFAPSGKAALEISLHEALRAGLGYIGTGHLLLGVTGIGEGVATQILSGLDVELASVRPTVLELVTDHRPQR